MTIIYKLRNDSANAICHYDSRPVLHVLDPRCPDPYHGGAAR